MKTNYKLVSIIVPVHNSEKYLHRCLRSLLEQTYKNIEIVLVENNSTDNSFELCCSFKESFSNILLIQAKEKSGPSYARNCGLKIANGDYIIFVDSDDYLDKDFVQKGIEQMVLNSSDIVVNLVDRGANRFLTNNYLFEFDDNYNSFAPYAARGVIGVIFKTSITNGVFFNEDIIIGEDLLYYTHCLLRAKKIFYYPNSPAYHYVVHEDSTYHSMSLSKNYTCVVAHKLVVDLMKETKYKKAMESAKKYYMYKCYDLANDIIKSKSKDKRKIKHKLLKHMFKLTPFIFFSIKKIRFSLKWIVLTIYCLF